MRFGVGHSNEGSKAPQDGVQRSLLAGAFHRHFRLISARAAACRSLCKLWTSCSHAHTAISPFRQQIP